jgi:hypothetical protein
LGHPFSETHGKADNQEAIFSIEKREGFFEALLAIQQD